MPQFPQKVQRGKRLVHQQQLCLTGQHPRKAQPLLHARGKLRRGEVGKVLQPDEAHEIGGLFIALLRRLAHAAGHGDVALYVRPRDDIRVRAEKRAVPALRHLDLSRVRLLLSGQQLQKRALAAAAAADNDRQLSDGETDGEIAQHLPCAALPRLAGKHDLAGIGCIGFFDMLQCDCVHKTVSVR